MKKQQLPRWALLAVGVVLVIARLAGWDPQTTSEVPPTSNEAQSHQPTQAPERRSDGSGQALLDRSIAERRSEVVVEASGKIVAVLPDDNRGSRHQRLLVLLPSGGTVLIAHNIDLAPRIANPRKGDRIDFRGQYEWNDKGGVIHWTHHDPGRRRPGGWLRHQGQEYR